MFKIFYLLFVNINSSSESLSSSFLSIQLSSLLYDSCFTLVNSCLKLETLLFVFSDSCFFFRNALTPSKIMIIAARTIKT